MIYLAVNVLSLVVLTQCVRYGQLRRMQILVTIMCNYLVAAAISGVVFFATPAAAAPITGGAFPLAILNGALYFTHFLLLLASYELAGLGITTALVASGGVIPVMISWLAWAEPMPWTRWLAVGLVPIAMFLLRPDKDGGKRMTLKGDAVLILAVLMGGTIMTIHKAAVVSQVGDQQSLYRFALFSVAAIVSTGYVALHRMTVRRREAQLGVAVGVFNSLGLWAAIMGLSILPAVVFYPIANCLVIVLNVVLSRLFWRERVTPRQFVGIGAAMLVVVLTNVGRGLS